MKSFLRELYFIVERAMYDVIMYFCLSERALPRRAKSNNIFLLNVHLDAISSRRIVMR